MNLAALLAVAAISTTIPADAQVRSIAEPMRIAQPLPTPAQPEAGGEHFSVICSDVTTIQGHDYFTFDCITGGKHMVIGVMLRIDETGSGNEMVSTNGDVARIASISAVVTTFVQLRAAGLKATLGVSGRNSKFGGHAPKAELVTLDR